MFFKDDDGYNASNATEFEDFEFAGCTSYAELWRHGRFHLAQYKLRAERYTFNADFASLNVSRNSHIRVAHGATLWGITQGRIVRRFFDEDDPEILTAIELDEYCPMEIGKSYGIRVNNGITIDTFYAVLTEPNVEDAQRILHFAAPVTINSGPQVGNMVAFGIAGMETAELIVLSVESGDNLTAKLTCCDASPGVYLAEKGAIPPFNSNITANSPWSIGRPARPTIVRVVSDSTAFTGTGGAVQAGIDVTYTVGGDLPKFPATVEIQYRLADGQDIFHAAGQGEFPAGTVRILNPESGQWYTIRARVVSSTGMVSDWTEQQHYCVGLLTPLADVTDLVTAFVGNRLNLVWSPIQSIRTVEYEIRRGSSWDVSVLVAIVPGASCPVPGDGHYLIKARALPAYGANPDDVSVTGSSGLSPNVIAVHDERSTGWRGTKVGLARIDRDVLITQGTGNFYDVSDVYVVSNIYGLDEVVTHGVYTIPDDHVISLAAPEMCAVYMEFDAHGIIQEDFYAHEDVFPVRDIYGIQSNSVQLTPQIRIKLNDEWRNWQVYTPGNYVGEAFDFRLIVDVLAERTMAEVSHFSFSVDVPDRQDVYSVRDIPASIQHLEFSRPFNGGTAANGAPNVMATVLDAREGETVNYFNVTKTGCDYSIMRGSTIVPGYSATIYVQGW